MDQNWRKALRAWANQCVDQFAHRDDILGVIMGGSLARGQEWQHSDLELGLLVSERLKELPYFNVIGGRGVEAIQLVKGELEEQIVKVEAGDLSPLSQWPIQLWRGRVIHDPTGVLGCFKAQFDPGLFRPEVVQQRVQKLKQQIHQNLAEARDLLSKNKPAAALVLTRLAMNDAILVYHWSHGELPRSQNRTDSRLRLVTRKHGDPAFYTLYRDVFQLDDVNRVIRRCWPGIKQQVLEITRLWGDPARDFFNYAVDGNFEWRQNAGILTVYRLYVPIIGGTEQGIAGKLDDEQWASENKDLIIFLGLDHASHSTVSMLVDRLENAIE